jgi:uncharacterized lipoprotein YddW (UPF0748 family)
MQQVRVRRRAWWSIALVAVSSCLLADVRVGAQADEVRALWVVRTTLTSPAAIDAMVRAARAGGFNTLLVQVRGRADAYYAGGLEPRASVLMGQPSFDPLAVTIARAHDAGLRVHAWINLNLVTGAGELPPARNHIIYRHPEWLMVPRALATGLAAVDPKSPEYLGRLLRYVRGQAEKLEGLYLSPVPAGAADYTVGIVSDIVQRYAVDGVHFDYVRYPSDDFDYGAETQAAFRRDVIADLGATDRQRYDRRLPGEPFIYAEAFPERWRRFRRDRLTMLVEKLRGTIRTIRPTAVVSAAVGPDLADASTRHLQDWQTWLERQAVDIVCPMAYTPDAALFTAQISAARLIAGGQRLWAGIGAYHLVAGQIVEHVQAARRLGAAGVVLFSYDALAEPDRGAQFVAQVGRAAFAQ